MSEPDQNTAAIMIMITLVGVLTGCSFTAVTKQLDTIIATCKAPNAS